MKKLRKLPVTAIPVAVTTVRFVAAVCKNVCVVFRQPVKGLLFQCSVSTCTVSVGKICVSLC